jgi:uncharacterized membrane protein
MCILASNPIIMIQRILLILLGIVVILVAAVVIIGWMNPTYSETLTVEVNAPADKTFAIFNEPKTMGEWLEGFVSMEVLEGDYNELGAKYKLTFEENGKPFSMIETITKFEENESIGFDLTDEHGGDFHMEITFVESDGKTTISETMTGSSNSVFGNAMMALMKGRINKQKTGWYEKLAEYIEGQEWAPPTPDPIPVDSTVVDSMTNE